MTIQLSTAVRNAMLDAIETAIGVSAILRVFTGAPPASCAVADSGVKLLEYALASDWAAAAAGGSKSLNGLPLSVNGLATGTAGYFRFEDSTGTTCHMQGTITATGGGGDATMDNTSVVLGQAVQIPTWSWTEPGA